MTNHQKIVMVTTQVIPGDCRQTLKTLPNESVQCCITSPPYFALRSYLPADHPDKPLEIGSEKTPEDLVKTLVEVFREVRRVLRNDGTLWVNMGDSYNGSGRSGGDTNNGTLSHRGKTNQPAIAVSNLKPKDLIGVPWMLAFALRADGWYLRQDIVWHKPNPMPESVSDRCTKSHEYIFLLTKSPKYFYDAQAISEPCSPGTHGRLAQNVAAQAGSDRANGGTRPDRPMKAVHGSWNGSEFHTGKTGEHQLGRSQKDRKLAAPGSGTKNNTSFDEAMALQPERRNKRSVWTVASEAFSEAHFATFPTDLIRPMILAGTSAGGCCSSCGTPLERQIELGAPNLAHQKACGGDANGEYSGKATKDYSLAKAQDPSAVKARILAGMREKITTGWKKTCGCEDAGAKPCTVLDPFGGSGTVGEVANEYGRDAILLELNAEYLPMIKQRTKQPGLALG